MQSSIKSVLQMYSDCFNSAWDGIKSEFRTIQVEEQEELIKVSHFFIIFP